MGDYKGPIVATAVAVGWASAQGLGLMPTGNQGFRWTDRRQDPYVTGHRVADAAVDIIDVEEPARFAICKPLLHDPVQETTPWIFRAKRQANRPVPQPTPRSFDRGVISTRTAVSRATCASPPERRNQRWWGRS